MAKRKSAEQVKEDRATRSQKNSEEAAKQNEPAAKAREERDEAVAEAQEKEHARRVKAAEAAAEEDEDVPSKVHKLSAKPGSGAGLRPGDWFAPSSNPGAAARVPSQPLQPESLQSHGKGILGDKDLDNPPYDVGDPLHTDAGPSGSGSPSNLGHGRTVDKEAERKKADKATATSRRLDPDNPTMAAGGPDPTASPMPIGTHRGGKNSRSGGSNSGI